MSSIARVMRNTTATLAVTLAVLSLPLFSQTNTGRILGNVHDTTDAVVVGATVTITDTQRGLTRTLTTDAAGGYTAPNLNPGVYAVRVTAPGFKNVDRQNIQLEVAQDVRLDFSLQPGSTEETVTVTSEVPLVNTTSSTLGGTLSNETISELPLNGRNFQKLLELRPGVYIFPGGGKWSQSTNGMRAEHNVYILNGIDTIEGFSSQSVLNAAPVFGDATSILPIDAIQEFNTQQNPKAEYGWKPGGIVNVGLKSGTNALHGTAYAFGRDSALDATNPFIPAGGPKQETAIEDFGGTIGGPIRKDKLFFLAGYEGQRNSIGAPATVNIPTRAHIGNAGQSLLDACNALTAATPPSALSLRMAGLTYGGVGNCAADPNNAGVFQDGTSTAFLSLPTGTATLDNVLGKVDYHLNEKHSLSGEYFFGNYTGLGPQGTVVHPYWETNTHSRVQIAGAHWTWVPNSRMVNEARWGLNRVYQPSIPGDCQQIGQPDFSYINTGTGGCGFPPITIGSFSGLGCCSSFPKIQGPDTTLQFIDGLSYMRGNHAIKFGGELRHLTYNGGTYRGSRGLFTFTDLKSFLQGTTSGVSQELLGNPARTVTDMGIAGYVQDDWRISNRVTLNLGMRYETVSPMKEANNQLANFDPNSPTGLVQVGKQISEPYARDGNNFSPRIGFAWDMKGDSRWVLRGGGSIIYVLEGFNVLLSQQGTRALTTGLNTIPTGALLNGAPGPGDITSGTVAFGKVNWTGNGSIFPANSALRCDSPLNPIPNNKPCQILAVDPNLRSPYVEAWNLSLQHAFSSNVSLEVAYVGNHGVKLIGVTDINAPTPGSGWAALPTGASACTPYSAAAIGAGTFTANCENLSRPYFSKFPYLSNINQIRNMDESKYDGLQATLTQRPWHGLSYILGYTWSHGFEQSQADWGGNIPSNPFNPAADYGPASFDVRQRLTVSLSYALPEKKGYGQMLEGWRVNSVMNFQSSPPWNVVDSVNDISGIGQFDERWNFFGDPSSFSALQRSSVPFFKGGSADCLAKAQALDGATTPLHPGWTNAAAVQRYGCYELNGAMMLPPAFGTFGTMGRNLFRGNGMRLWDMSLTKQVKMTERLSGEFRFEVFNVMNMVQYALPAGPNVTQSNNGPGSGAGNPLFGASRLTPDVAIANPQVGSGAARSIQLGFKMKF